MKDLDVYKPLTLRPDFSRSHTPPERHALDSDDFSEQGMLRDMERRRDYDITRLRETAPPVERVKVSLDDPQTRAVWETAQRAADEVASWPAWKRGDVAVPPDSPDRSDVECGCARPITTDDLTLAQVRAVRTAMLQAQAALLGLHRDARTRLRTTQHAAEILIANWTTARLENQRRLVCDIINSAACVPHK